MLILKKYFYYFKKYYNHIRNPIEDLFFSWRIIDFTLPKQGPHYFVSMSCHVMMLLFLFSCHIIMLLFDASYIKIIYSVELTQAIKSHFFLKF